MAQHEPDQDAKDAQDRLDLEGARSGDSASHRALFDRYANPVYRFVLRRLSDPSLSDEAVADVFFEVWRSAEKFRGESRVSTWIYGIAHYKCLAIRRDRARDGGRLVYDNVELLHGSRDEFDVERAMDARKSLRRVERVLASLSEEHREVIHLAFVEGLEYPAIAERLGISQNTVKTRVLRARRKLRKESPQLHEGLER